MLPPQEAKGAGHTKAGPQHHPHALLPAEPRKSGPPPTPTTLGTSLWLLNSSLKLLVPSGIPLS